MDDNELIKTMRDASVIAVDLIQSGGAVTSEIAIALDSNDPVKNVDFFGLVLHQVMMQAELAKARIVQWQAVQQSSEDALKNLKGRMKFLMEAAELKQIVGEQSTFNIVPVQPTVVVKNMKAVPPDFITTEFPDPIRKVETEKILAELTQGKTVPGCELSKDTLLIHKVSLKGAN